MSDPTTDVLVAGGEQDRSSMSQLHGRARYQRRSTGSVGFSVSPPQD